MDINIPDWNDIGIIPPLLGASGVDFNRSPYKASAIELVDKYAFNSKRASILAGFLAFRSRLYSTGIIEGFQWVDGSFTENVELTLLRKPNDIDLVTFFKIPSGETENSILQKDFELFTPKVKELYLVDAYWQGLDDDPVSLVQMSAYWYSMWSHKRDMSWKGFLQIPLSEQDDSQASIILNNKILGGFDD
ncbi:TPA: hypothetical protein U2R10_003920 [Proteus mirabilis]|uniref:DUF6932 family protein n=1 Tax=Morganella morganii TaxID=582 RepID=UPI000DFD11DB|nr:hypothetical protein [Morganella morganii]HDT0713423.1 hypothetical protein [Morganella morganii subsp. morganii]HEM8846847.1 hypothetical protein [Proteus mirabilis]MDU2633243.1 hypothetical protein [Morganella morganii]STZ19172.1 Uncharacterised protein [Morganella morganii]HCD1106422.1 hypothetical protein [Morganella morganii]